MGVSAHGIQLDNFDIQTLQRIVYGKIPVTIEKLSKDIGIKYFQLWNVLNKRTRCSPESAKKIRRYLEGDDTTTSSRR